MREDVEEPAGSGEHVVAKREIVDKSDREKDNVIGWELEDVVDFEKAGPSMWDEEWEAGTQHKTLHMSHPVC